MQVPKEKLTGATPLDRPRLTSRTGAELRFDKASKSFCNASESLISRIKNACGKYWQPVAMVLGFLMVATGVVVGTLFSWTGVGAIAGGVLCGLGGAVFLAGAGFAIHDKVVARKDAALDTIAEEAVNGTPEDEE
jgi:hypothetical protein